MKKYRSIFSKKPSLKKEWDYNRNLEDPEQLSYGSEKIVWWICRYGHRWQTKVNNRTSKNSTGCPNCYIIKKAKKIKSKSGVEVCRAEDYNLEYCFPAIIQNWSTQNTRSPKSFSPFSGATVIWDCKVCKQSYPQKIFQKTSRGAGCPYCSGRKTLLNKSLALKRPDLLTMWDYSKNLHVKPEEVGLNSAKMAFWKCEFGHRYERRIVDQVNGKGCKDCNFSGVSSIEVLFFCELRFYLGKDVVHGAKILGCEVDIFIPKYKVAIEVDGWKWHKDKIENDKRKNNILAGEGIHLFRFREFGLSKTSSRDFVTIDRTSFNRAPHSVFVEFLHHVNSKLKSRRIQEVHDIAKSGEYLNLGAYHKSIQSSYTKSLSQNLESTFPQVVKMWDFKKNGDLDPACVGPKSSLVVWWRCLEVENHLFQDSVINRTITKKASCPICLGKVVTSQNSLKSLFPSLLLEWSSKNICSPDQVAVNSHKVVLWKCLNNRAHPDYPAMIKNKTQHRSGCPACSGRTILHSSSLLSKSPLLCNEWAYFKNTIMPDEVGESSGVVVWWICENMHIWPASPNHRKRRIKCPTCAGKKVYGDDFEIINGSIQQLKTIRRVLGKDKRLDITTRALIGKISDIQAIFEKDVKKKFIIAINQKPSLDVSMEYNKIRRFELGISKVVEDYKGTGLFIHLKTPVNSSTRRMLEKEVNRHKTFSSFIIKPIYFRENELLIFNVDEYLTKLIRVLTQLKRKRKSIYIDRILSLISD